MLNKLSYERKSYPYTQKKSIQKNKTKRIKKKLQYSLIFSLLLIIISSSFLTHNLYIEINSKDLQFAAEHNFTAGFFSKDKLLRVQNMSLIYSDGESSIIEAYGLSKSEPHKKVIIKGIFRKDSYKSWYLEKIIS